MKCGQNLDRFLKTGILWGRGSWRSSCLEPPGAKFGGLVFEFDLWSGCKPWDAGTHQIGDDNRIISSMQGRERLLGENNEEDNQEAMPANGSRFRASEIHSRLGRSRHPFHRMRHQKRYFMAFCGLGCGLEPCWREIGGQLLNTVMSSAGASAVAGATSSGLDISSIPPPLAVEGQRYRDGYCRPD